MSEIQKVLNLIQGWGRKFSKSSEIQKVLNYPRRGGSSLIGNFSQIFPFFFSDGSPKFILMFDIVIQPLSLDGK